MQRLESETEKLSRNESISNRSSFALSEVGSLYFGPNPSNEARRLLEQAKELIRENERIQEEKAVILKEEAELRNRKVYLNSENLGNNVFQPNAELRRLMSETISLSDEGKEIDKRKAQLQLYYNELKRRKEFLQNAIRTYEETELGHGFPTLSLSDQINNPESNVDKESVIL